MNTVNCKSRPLSREDLEVLIKRRPETWSRFASFLGTLPLRREIPA